jgi:hypothetical protein
MFKLYDPGRGLQKNIEGDLAQVSKTALRFSRAFYEEVFKKKPFVNLYFDEENRQIGFMGTDERTTGLTVYSQGGKHKGSVPRVDWKTFLAKMGVVFERPINIMIKKGINGMFVLDLKKNGDVKS